MDTQIDQRFKRSWQFFEANAASLLLGSAVVLLGSLLVVPAPWFAMNLLGEVQDCLATGRPVRWQASYDRPGLFLSSWGLAITAGLGIAFGTALCIVPGVMLALLWMQAPGLVASGKGVFQSLGESMQMVSRSGNWTAYVLNALVLVALSMIGGSVGVLTLLTLPLSMIYAALCHLDAVQPSYLPPTTGIRSLERLA